MMSYIYAGNNCNLRYETSTTEVGNNNIALERPHFPPPHYPRPAPPVRYEAPTNDQLSDNDMASTFSYRSAI